VRRGGQADPAPGVLHTRADCRSCGNDIAGRRKSFETNSKSGICFKSWGGAGKKGGLREYARQIGRAHPQVVQWIQSAEVAKTGKTFYQLFDRTYHLAAIHAAPQELWPVFVEALLAQDWTDRRSAKKPAGYPAPF